MNAKNIFMMMFCAIPEGMELANEPDKYEVTFLTSAGFIQGTIDNDFMRPFEDIGQKITDKFALEGLHAESLSKGDFFSLKDVVISQTTGSQINLRSMVVFTDQVIAVTLAKPIFVSKNL